MFICLFVLLESAEEQRLWKQEVLTVHDQNWLHSESPYKVWIYLGWINKVYHQTSKNPFATVSRSGGIGYPVGLPAISVVNAKPTTRAIRPVILKIF